MPTPNPITCDTVSFPDPALGTTRSWTALRFGIPGTGPKAYIHAGLHADELPGLLVCDHLGRLLEAAAARGEILGEIILVPFTNPIGLSQWVNNTHVGRFELGRVGNFNRGYPVLGPEVAKRIGTQLTDDATTNVALIRQTMREILAEIDPVQEMDFLRVAILSRAIDADIALDLHCDTRALMHLYIGTPLWPDAADLAAELGAHATLLAEDSGGSSLDEAIGGPWWYLARTFPEKPIPPACLATTVELRGESDVTDELAGKDAAALYRFLQRRSVIAGDPGPLPILLNDATDLTASDLLISPIAGVLVYKVGLGDQVKTGDVVAEVVNPLTHARTPIKATTDGFILVMRYTHNVRPGFQVAKVVGTVPLSHRQGYLLTD
jgi:uncharacterized protein